MKKIMKITRKISNSITKIFLLKNFKTKRFINIDVIIDINKNIILSSIKVLN